MPRFDVYSRQGCHLCEVLIEQLVDLVDGEAEVAVHDVDRDAALAREYGVRVPVVRCAGRLVCEARLDPAAVRAALAEQA
ncbi:MAG: glutaredoxin family protein [Woeseiaceae bacterium]|nr:glutaredoxin family protein [Woeseiaceae bacterium]